MNAIVRNDPYTARPSDARRRPRRPAPPGATPRRAIDPLERRLLLSAVHDPETGLLTVNGTAAGETIEVELYFDPTGAPPAHQIRTRVGAAAQVFTGNPLTLPQRIIVNAGPGNDTVRVFSSGELTFLYIPSVEALGGDGDDTITLEFGAAASVSGGAGNDRLLGGNRPDLLDGGPGDDTLAGGADADTLRGGTGNDRTYAGEGDDSLEGGPGNDLLRGQHGNDTLAGNAGDDVLDGDWGADTAAYNDVPHYGGVRASIADGPNDGAPGEHDDVLAQTEILLGSFDADTLAGDDADNTLRGNGGRDSLVGNGGHDRLVGGADHDTLRGGRGNDTLIGGARIDHLYGERGDDTLDGGAARDHVYPGPGADTHNEGFFDSGPAATLDLVGFLRYYNGVEGPDWKLQGGATQHPDDLLPLDVAALLPQAEKRLGQRVRITGTIAHVLSGQDRFRVLTVTTISPA